MKKFFKSLLQVASKIITVFLIIILIYILYSKYIAKNKITKIGGYGFLVVVSGSMEPEIEIDELVIIKEQESYNIGDIITYDFKDYLITHRIIDIQDSNITTKGDSNNKSDVSIESNQIEGKVIYHSKILGIFVVYYLKIILAIFIIFTFIINIKKDGDRSEKQEKKPTRYKRKKPIKSKN